jgi:hypothetical protein
MMAENEQKQSPEVPPAGEHLEVDSIVELVKRICITRSNLTLYSFEHAVAKQDLQQTYRVLDRLLEERNTIGLDVHKNTLLFEGLPIEERNPMVERITRDFHNLHVQGVSFQRGLTMRELALFFKLLTLKREDLEKYGGPIELLKKGGVEHIGINRARYVRLEEDQKIVSKTAHVAEGFSAGEEEAEQELLHQLWEELRGRQVDREWLLEEVRTDPKRVAGQIVALLKHYDDLEMIEHQEKRQEALDSLMSGIKTLGARLAERDKTDDSSDEDKETIAQSMLILENELKTRSAGLKTSKAATHFIREITSTVTAFIDNLQAGQIVKEYLKDEKGLKRTEQLLRQVVKRDPAEKIMPRLQDLMLKKGMTEKDFEGIIDRLSASPARKAPKKKRKRRPRAPLPVQEKIEKALDNKLKSEEDRDTLASYLSGLLERTTKDKIEKVERERGYLAGVLKRLETVMSKAGLELVVLDEEDNPALFTPLARERLAGALAEEKLDGDLGEFLARGEITSAPARESFLARQTDEKRKRFSRILAEVKHPILDENGRILGLVLKSGGD